MACQSSSGSDFKSGSRDVAIQIINSSASACNSPSCDRCAISHHARKDTSRNLPAVAPVLVPLKWARMCWLSFSKPAPLRGADIG